jgi:hypothetical protein
VYTLEVLFAFVDADGRAQESSEVISLLVGREIKLSINAVDPITTTVVGAAVPFSVEVVNAGEGTVRVGDVEVRGSRSLGVTDGRRYVGSLDAGALDVVDAMLLPKAPGKAEVTVVVHYADDFNRQGTEEKTFPLEVDAAPAGGEVEPEVPAGPRNLVVRIIKGLLGLGASQPPDGGQGTRGGGNAAPPPAAGGSDAAPAVGGPASSGAP